MNNLQIKEKLKQLAESPDFEVILSGKKSRKVDGLYKPFTKEIIIHSENMKGDNDTMYTAIHEYAHHVQCSSSGVPVTGRCHTKGFWAALHSLLAKAEELGIYTNDFRNDAEFKELTKKIREDYIKKNGQLMKELGAMLYKAKKMCYDRHFSFDDYTDRELGIHRTIASALISVHGYDISPNIGYENMKTVAAIKSHEKRVEAEKSFMQGESPDAVKVNIIDTGKNPSQLTVRVDGKDQSTADLQLKQLIMEKKRIEKTIDTLEKRLSDVEAKLSALMDASAMEKLKAYLP